MNDSRSTSARLTSAARSAGHQTVTSAISTPIKNTYMGPYFFAAGVLSGMGQRGFGPVLPARRLPHVPGSFV